MNTSYYALLFSLLHALSPIQAQDFNDYQLLESTGTIPNDFLTCSSEKYKQQLERAELSNEKETNNNTDKFLLESNFLVDNLLRSARVLFNDPITAYIDKVADNLLQNDPEMRQRLRFYAVRSSAVNAFATNQGIIFVNVGLIAQLETEAQLAFILAHEITHVRHQHALEMYLKSERIDNYSNHKKVLSESDLSKDLIVKNHYSKELETHADAEGLELYLKSKYTLKDLDGTFDVLQYSYLPFDIVTIEREALELPNLSLPEDLFLTEEDINPIDGSYEEDDSKSTHPSIDKRRTAVAVAIAMQSNKGRQSFVVSSKEEFETMRDVARFEVAYYYLHQIRFQDALYATYILQEKYPNSKYLKKIRAKALYGYTKFRNEWSGVKPYSTVYKKNQYPLMLQEKHYKKVEGPSQQIYHWLKSMKAEEVNIYALRYAWDVAAEYPEDKEVQTIVRDLFNDLAFHYKKRSEFSATSYAEMLAYQKEIADKTGDNPKKETKEEGKNLSKYDKIKRKKKEQVLGIVSDSTVNYFHYAFADIHGDSTFKDLFKKGQAYAENYKKRRDYYYSSTVREKLRQRRKRRYITMGIDSVLVYNPVYWKVESGNKMSVNYLESEAEQLELSKRLPYLADKVNLHLKLLTPSGLSTSDAEAFNELRVLAEWLSQQNSFGDNIYSDGYNQDKVEDIIAKYGTPYLLFTGVVNTKERGRRNSFLWVVVFDLRAGTYQVIKDNYFHRKAGKILLNSQYYDALLQIKTPSKKEAARHIGEQTTVSVNAKEAAKKDKS